MRAERRTGGLAVGVGRASLVLAVVAVFLTAGPSDRLSAQVDRTKPPALPPPPALKLPAVQTTMLPNGLMIAVVEMHKVPVVDVQLLLDAGAARDPSGVTRLATFTVHHVTRTYMHMGG